MDEDEPIAAFPVTARPASIAPPPPPPGSRPLLADPDFLKLWTAQAISELGSRITREGIPLTALLVLHAGAVRMGLLNAVGGIAVLVFGLAAGVWIDRLRRRPVLIAADLGRAALLASIPAAALAGRLGMAQLYAVAALAGVMTVFFVVADQSYLPALVDRDRILEANSKLTLSSTLAEIAGPGLTGFLVQAITAPIAILFDALSFLVSALLLAGIRKREPPPPRRPPEHVLAATLAGVRHIFADPLLRPLGLRSATAWVFHGFLGSLYLLFAIDVLRLRPAVLGIVIATGGAGAMAGAFLAPRLERRVPLGPTFLATSALYGLTFFLVPLAGLAGLAGTARPPAAASAGAGSPGGWLAVAMLIAVQLIGDMAYTVYSINEVSLRQRVAPADLLGRINAGMQLLARGVYPLGALLGGYLGERLGIRPTLALAAAGLLLSTLWLLPSPLRRLR
jgi:MFS family permease